MPSSFSSFYKFFLKLIMFIWTLICIFLSYKISSLFSLNTNLLIPNSILGLLFGIVSSSYLYTILLIPYELGVKFDTIKNKVAQYTYKSTEEFQKEIADFIHDFFKYPGAFVTGGIYQFIGAPTLHINAPGSIINANTLAPLIQDESVKRIELDRKNAFIVPIQLGNIPLGYMILFTKRFTFPLFRAFLSDFENYCLDDQLMHVVRQTQTELTNV